MKNKSYLLAISLLFLLLGLLFLSNFFSGKNIYTITYNSDFKYVLEVKKSYIKVNKYDVIECIKAPCEPIKIDSFNVSYKEEYKKFIESLFRNSISNELTINYSDLDNDDIKIMSLIVSEKIKKSKYPYKIIDSSEYDTRYENRGYYIDSLEKIVTISMGLKNTGGYSISINRIVEEDNTIKIYVNEIKLDSDIVVTQELTIPLVQIKFSKLPDNIFVYNAFNNEEFQMIK